MKKTITRFLVWLAAFVVMDVITMSSAGLAAKFYNAVLALGLPRLSSAQSILFASS